MKKSIIKVMLLIVLIVSFWITQVWANSFNMIATPDKQTIKPGDVVTINLGISNIDAGDLGINTIETQLSYDSDVFEKVTQEEVKSENNWSLTYNAENNGGKLLGVIIASGVKEDQDSIGKITLKAKTNISKTETTIKFSQVTSNDGKELIIDTDKEIKLQISNDNNNQNNTNTNTNNTNTNTNNTNTNNTNTNNTNTNTNTNNTNNNTNNTNTNNANNTANNGNTNGQSTSKGNTSGGQTSNSGSKASNTSISGQNTDKTTSTKILPSTGIASMILIAIIVLIISAVFCVYKMKQY